MAEQLRGSNFSARPLLLSFLILTFFGGCAAVVVFQGISHARQNVDPPPTLHLRYDENGDLWVQTPLFSWNITGGKSVSVHVDGSWKEWSPEPGPADRRVLDTLFLTARITDSVRSRIIFALGDRAIVYVERDTPSGAEGIEIAFRATDDLARLTYAWTGGEVPAVIERAAEQLSNLEAQFVREMSEGLSAQQRLHLAANYSFFVSHDPAQESAYERFLAQESRRIGRPRSGCVSGDQAQASPSAAIWSGQGAAAGADDPCRFMGFFVPGHILGSRYLYFSNDHAEELLQANQETNRRPAIDAPDLNATYITRLPRYSYRAAKNGPERGEPVSFVAHVTNRGNRPSGPFEFDWSLDERLVLTGFHRGIEPGEEITLSLEWAWQAGPYTVGINVDPDDAITEMSEQNNEITDRTDALAVGFWVEQSVYDYFNTHQRERRLGGTSWEDWAQRQLSVLNRMFADAVHPLTPDGIQERVRLDKVTVVPDGGLPACATHYPDLGDESVDLQWGFPAELVGISAGHICGSKDHYFNHPDFQDVEYPLLHELSHARYLVDLYGLNVVVGQEVLARSIDSQALTMPVEGNVEADDGFPLPAYLEVGGELVVCQAKSGNLFVQCTRGAEGTRARSHPRGTAVRTAVVRIQDGDGNLVQGSKALPVEEGLLYRNPYPEDLMSGGIQFQQHSAYAWNRIAGSRPCCGNTHAPPNLGEYLNDLPANNVVEIQGADGRPLPGVTVSLFRAQPMPVWYGKLYLKNPDAVQVTDAGGRVSLGPNPFSTGPHITHQYGYSNGVALLQISTPGGAVYRFFDVTAANEAYWRGSTEEAVYVIRVSE